MRFVRRLPRSSAVAALGNWVDLCRRLGAGRGIREVHARLTRCYSTPPRAYHNLRHVARCLAEFEPLREQARNATAVEFALWFHDAVYDPRRRDNELRSAEMASSCAARMHRKAAFCDLAYALVLDTRHASRPKSTDGRIIADVDLAILGQSPGAFAVYERGIREEYSWVPEGDFRAARARLLRRFLERPAIYFVPQMAARYEATARANLARSIRRLEEAGG
jgi:predicted metal-dependent HD superfamily phosphohydrolase